MPRDWAATLRTDARALNDDIAVNHPGLANDGIPMKVKVYRGRPRGYNEPVVPTHRFDGDITDTSALERWIAALPR